MAGAQVRSSTARITGVVVDSLSGQRLSGAMVQLVSADSSREPARTTESDAGGEFRIDSVPAGRYLLGFFHPLLDSLGLAPVLTSVELTAGHDQHVNLAVPGSSRIRAAACASVGDSDASAVLMGVIRDALTGAPLDGAEVDVKWSELSLTANRIVARTPRASVRARPNGWFAVCGLPADGSFFVTAGYSGDSTDAIELTVPADRLLHRDLFIGRAGAPSSERASRFAGTLERTGRSATTGPDGGRTIVRGIVTAAETGKPLSGVRIILSGSAQTSTDNRGEWTLTDAPLGSRMLVVRAVGFYPDRVPIDVVPGALPVRVALPTLRSILDTIRVDASRTIDRHHSGFEERRRQSGSGRFLTPTDIARREVRRASEIFRMVSGVQVEAIIRIRGPFGPCTPSLFVDGQYVPPGPDGLTPDDLDDWVRPDEIAGIEVYFDVVPPQFRESPPPSQQKSAGCGAIVIWTK